MADQNIDLEKIKDELYNLKQKYNNDLLNTNDVLLCTESKLDHEHLLQRQEELRQNFDVFVDNLWLKEIQKPMDQWITTTNEEEAVEGSEDILSEAMTFWDNLCKRHKPLVDKTREAHRVLNEKLTSVSSKIQLFEEKCFEVFGPSWKSVSSGSGLKEHHQHEIERTKYVSLLSAAQEERCLLKNRISRLEGTLELIKCNSTSAHTKELVLKRKLSILKGQAALLERLFGVSCTVSQDWKVNVEFLSNGNGQAHAEGTNQKKDPETEFILCLEFEEDEDQCFVLSHAVTNRVIRNSKTLLETAVREQALSKLILQLKTLWHSHMLLFEEISPLRERYAIDWMEAESKLLIMVGKGKCVMCTLRIPPSYPHSGAVSLEEIMGSSSFMNVDSVPRPDSYTLTGWLTHLEDILSKETV